MWGMCILPGLWNEMPPYAIGQFGLELQYLGLAFILLLTFMLGPVWALVMFFDFGKALSKEVETAERLCVEKAELEESERKWKKEP